MLYNKPPATICEQIEKLKSRGLKFRNEGKAISYLSNISYYRLRAYTYPFQDNSHPDHPFTAEFFFDEIIDLYVFDRQFKLFVLDAIEKIEISIRTQIIHNWAMSNGSHWHLDSKLYRDKQKFERNGKRLLDEISRSNETFIKHYREKYSTPEIPPCWMSLEVSSFGLLSLLFENLKWGQEKKAITKYFGLNDVSLLENWMHSFSNIRNICAHHGRLWNRRLSAHIKLPTHPVYGFIANTAILPYKVYASLCCMKYILNIISPGNTFSKRLKDLMLKCPLAQEKEMGFPRAWELDLFWQD